MSPRRCIIDGCNALSIATEFPGVTFHTIPLNAEQRKKWLIHCRLPETINITKSVVVCSQHFLPIDFQAKSVKTFLRAGAVPTIFPWGTLPYEELPSSPATIVATANTEAGDTSTDPVNASNDVSISSTAPSGTSLNPPANSQKSTETPSTTKKYSTRGKSLGNISKTHMKTNSASGREQLTAKTEKPLARKSVGSTVVARNRQPNEGIIKSPQKRVDFGAKFQAGDKVEAQDFSGVWHSAKIVEVDQAEMEVLINFEKTADSKGPTLNDEWISMNSNRLRRLQSTIEKDTFKVGEACRARWSDSRKFDAIILEVLKDDKYLVEFSDKCRKVVKGAHISRPRPTATKATISSVTSTPTRSIISETPSLLPKSPLKSNSIPKFDLSQFDFPEIRTDGEWCCRWINDVPIGRQGFLQNADGTKRETVIVDDWRLPPGWIKHLYQRSNSGKWDVILTDPTNKRYRTKNDLKDCLEKQGERYNADVYDFSIHKRRSKDVGVCKYTQDYVPPVVVKPGFAYIKVDSAAPSVSAVSQDPKDELSTTALQSTPLSTTAAEIEPVTPLITPQQADLEEGYVNVGGLKVQIVDNLFKCPSCIKSFRKDNVLQIHVKHSHPELLKQLGACPNMTELAYIRTMGTPKEEITPKTQHTPNIHASEKIHLTKEKQTKSIRKTSSSDSPVIIKGEPKFDNSIISIPLQPVDSSEGLKRKADTDTKHLEPEEKKKPPVDDQKAIEPVEPVFLPHAHTTPTIIPEIPITMTPTKTSNPPVTTGKRGRPKKSQIHRFKLTKVARPVGRPKGSKKPKKVYKKVGRSLKNRSFIPTSSYENQTISLQESNAANQHYINEDGKIIKIVHLRQEEIINCLCSVGFEDGLMVQCELCLCWQHGACNGFEKQSDVPDKYVCYICRNPTRGRASMKYIHDQDWLYEGKLAKTSFHPPSKDSQQRFEILKQSHSLTGNLLDLKRSIHGINAKINILHNKDHPKLYLWSKKWEQSSPKDNMIIIKNEQKNDVSEGNIPAGQEQKPTMHEGIDGKEEKANIDQTQLPSPSAPMTPIIPEPEAAINPAECQMKLLDHIQKEQDLILARMQIIDAQIIALEAMEERTDSNSNADFARTSQTIHMLLNDLTKLSKLANINRMTLDANTSEAQHQYLI